MPYIGIDFGTSNSVVANFQFGQAEVVPTHEGLLREPLRGGGNYPQGEIDVLATDARLAESWMARIQAAAYRASSELAREKGAFPLFNAEAFLAAPNVQAQPAEVRAAFLAAMGITEAELEPEPRAYDPLAPASR